MSLELANIDKHCPVAHEFRRVDICPGNIIHAGAVQEITPPLSSGAKCP
jgi:hypothetical protein